MSDHKQVTSAGNSVTIQVKIENRPGMFSSLLNAVAECGGSLAEVFLLYSDYNYNIRKITINCRSEEHAQSVLEVVKAMPAVALQQWKDDTFVAHEGGKFEIVPNQHLHTTDELARAYTPGVARVCTAIAKDPEKVYRYTTKGSMVAVVTDGSAVLGLGNIGPKAALPVMEGKAVLFKQFAGVDAFPICLDTQDTEEIIAAVKQLSPGFGGINLEDISAPRCFEIERRLREELDIPVFHDDQHGTAIVVLAGVMNALRFIGKSLEQIRVVVNGFGAGGVACTRMLLAAGVKDIVPCDRAGIVYRGRTERMNPVKEELIQVTNPENLKGSVGDALKGADVFVGVSKPGTITVDMVASMAKDPIVFALANPTPEIYPDEIRHIAAIIATGRSDYANQVNNVLCFPGMFRGAMDARATDISEAMKVAAAHAIASSVAEDELSANYIIPGIFRGNIGEKVAEAVKKAAEEEGLIRGEYE